MSETLSRSSDETLLLFKKALYKRRLYLRRRIEEIDSTYTNICEQRIKDGKSKRGRASEDYRVSKVIMLSEIVTIQALLKEIESGSHHPDDVYNPEDDTPFVSEAD
ncbi:hypothetical protein JOD82_002040 [Paenibacillus sp. 1182]|uniref:hypothetical protein n=1 Tax=Paenibacillus sp. 1182 TaxID=2806565 RepID=UPI001AE7B7EA|nr:hypothetical protein [Paenibacillus sp. 1182]MBP1309020.1 hypothetical protein [Paenibacillus sp. 1182]